MNPRPGPRISLGLPVYNGENYVAAAIDSVLEQTFQDFELVICDNDSSDRTGEICRDFASRDSRISYHCNERNLGSAPNFNRCVELSSGEYFKWVCHDDLMTPQYVERCMAMLEANPDAVLCHSLVRLIGPREESLDIYDSQLVGADSGDAPTRFAALVLRPHQCTDLDGVMRMDALRSTALLGAFHGSDRSLLAELGMTGRILQIPEPLFMTREHPDRYRRAAVRPEERQAFHDTTTQRRFLVPTWTLYADYLRSIRTHGRGSSERARARLVLLRWWFVNWNWARVLVDLISVPFPGALVRAEKLKQRIFSPEPGPTVPEGFRQT